VFAQSVADTLAKLEFCGSALTVTADVVVGPAQVFAVGVIVNVVVTEVVTPVPAVSDPVILPLPLALIPVAPVVPLVLFLVQLKVVLATAPESVICEIADPEQIV